MVESEVLSHACALDVIQLLTSLKNYIILSDDSALLRTNQLGCLQMTAIVGAQIVIFKFDGFSHSTELPQNAHAK